MPNFDTSVGILAGIFLLAYLIGSVPFGVLVARAFKLPDPRGIGSGSIGATNVLRTGSKTAALLTVFLDAAKGTLAVLIGLVFFGDDAAQIAALGAVLGHCYSFVLKFKGGKGVATILGVILALSPMVALMALGAWLFTYFVFRYSSLSALLAALVTPPVAAIVGFGHMFILLIVLSLILIWRHRSNISRLRDGTEPMVDWGKK